MPVCRRARVDRPVEREMLANSARLEAHQLGKNLFQPRLIDLSRPVQIDIDGKRV
jgi:hypothetical protein